MKAEFMELMKRGTGVALLALLVVGSAAGGVKGRKNGSADIVAHFSAAGSDAVVIAKREIGRKLYLFVNEPSQKAVAVLDITNAKKPKVIKSVAYPDGAQSTGEIFGTNLLLVKAEKAEDRGKESPVQVIAFGGPEGSDGSQQFTGLTSFLADDDRGLVYFTNADGLWIVRSKRTPPDTNDNLGLSVG